jgi:hypothetical protein
VDQARTPRRKSNNYPGFDGAGPGVTLRSSKLKETIRQLGFQCKRLRKSGLRQSVGVGR